jgi:hypothetical protein
MKRLLSFVTFAVVAILVLGGCGANTYKSYGWFKTPEQPPAIFKPDKNVAINNIDSKNIFVTTRNWWLPIVTKTRAAVLPGEHTLHIKYAVAGWQSLGCELKVEAESGKTYSVKAKSYAMDAPEGRDGFIAVNKPRAARVVVWVKDTATDEKVSFDGGCTEIKTE